MNAGQNDDELVPRIRSPANQAGVTGRLAGLDVPDHQSSPVPRARPVRILQQAQYRVDPLLQAVDSRAVEPFFEIEKFPVPIPVLPFEARALRRKPHDVVGRVLQVIPLTYPDI